MKPKASHVWERDPHDWYVEGERVTDQLLTVETFSGWTHDPCCGGGNIVRAGLRAGLVVTGSDLVQRAAAPWHMGVSDFLDPADVGLWGADNCIFNPPFYRAKGAEACVRRALGLAPGKVAAFLESRFLQGSGRAAGLFHDHPPSRVWVVTPRPSCPPGAFLAAGGKAGNGTADFFWFIWDADRPRTTALGWLK